MASSSTTQNLIEVIPLNKPPFFYGNNFTFWKEKMTLYIQSYDLKMWKLIKKGYEFPTKVVDGITLIKDLNEMNGVEELRFIYNQRSIYMLVNAIDRNEYNKVRHCRTAKEI